MLDTIVIGGGPAGLATARELARRRVRHVVLERGRVGESWRGCYDSLRLHTGKHLSKLPGLSFPQRAPLFPTRDDLISYLETYRRSFDLPVEERAAVASAERRDDVWQVRTADGRAREAATLVVATGIMPNPYVPAIPGRSGFGGRVLHSVEYRNPVSFRGRRVLVVGIGNSGAEIASELGRAGVEVEMAVRSGANVVPLTLFGLPIQYHAWLLRGLPRTVREVIAAAVRRFGDARRGAPPFPRAAHSALDAIPLIGFGLAEAIQAGRVGLRVSALERFTTTGVRFADGEQAPFDDVILATGFRPALGFLGERITTDGRGFALREDRVRSAELPGLVFVGHNYDSVGGLRNIFRDAPLAAEAVRMRLAGRGSEAVAQPL